MKNSIRPLVWDATPKEAVAHSPTYQGSHSTARRILVRRTRREKIMAELKQTVEDNVLLSAAARRLRVSLALYLVTSLVALRLTRNSPHSTKTPHPGSSSLLQHCGLARGTDMLLPTSRRQGRGLPQLLRNPRRHQRGVGRKEEPNRNR